MALKSDHPHATPDRRVVGRDSRQPRRREKPVRGMTPNQELHKQSIIKRVGELIDAKYRKGVNEHGGNLWDLPIRELVDNAIDEAIDQLAYLLTVKDQLTRLPRFGYNPTKDFDARRRQ